MKLRDARLCAQCEEIYEGSPECPSCTSAAFIQICKFVPTAADFGRWTKQLDETLMEEKAEDVTASPAREPRPYTERRSAA